MWSTFPARCFLLHWPTHWVSEKTDACGLFCEKGRRICSSVNWMETHGVSCVGVMQWLTHTVTHTHTNCGPCYLTQTVTPWLWVWSPGSWNPLQCEQQTDSTVQSLILCDQCSHRVFITLHNALHTWWCAGGVGAVMCKASESAKTKENESSAIKIFMNFQWLYHLNVDAFFSFTSLVLFHKLPNKWKWTVCALDLQPLHPPTHTFYQLYFSAYVLCIDRLQEWRCGPSEGKKNKKRATYAHSSSSPRQLRHKNLPWCNGPHCSDRLFGATWLATHILGMERGAFLTV